MGRRTLPSCVIFAWGGGGGGGGGGGSTQTSPAVAPRGSAPCCNTAAVLCMPHRVPDSLRACRRLSLFVLCQRCTEAIRARAHRGHRAGTPEGDQDHGQEAGCQAHTDQAVPQGPQLQPPHAHPLQSRRARPRQGSRLQAGVQGRGTLAPPAPLRACFAGAPRAGGRQTAFVLVSPPSHLVQCAHNMRACAVTCVRAMPCPRSCAVAANSVLPPARRAANQPAPVSLNAPTPHAVL